MPKPLSNDLPPTEVEPDVRLEKRTRRVFSTEYKLRVIAEADQCQHGELGPLLRREKLYHGQLQTWRRELAEGGESALGKSAPGPAPRLTPEQKELERLKQENARLARQLAIAEDCISLQKNRSRPLRRSSEGEKQSGILITRRGHEPLAFWWHRPREKTWFGDACGSACGDALGRSRLGN